MNNLFFLFYNLVYSIAVFSYYNTYGGKNPAIFLTFALFASVVLWLLRDHDIVIWHIYDEEKPQNAINITLSGLLSVVFMVVLYAVAGDTKGDYDDAKNQIKNMLNNPYIPTITGGII